jgi:scyllo-inositol 2-dehydrogenase (NADP+)
MRSADGVFRVGVIGTGWVAQDRHLPSFRSVPGVEIVGVYDRDPERARVVAGRLGIGLIARDRDELLAAGLDAVSIATSPWSHAEHTRAALEAGVHVFCEKPMALDLVEATSMAEAATAAGRILTISHNFDFARSTAIARAYLGPNPGLLFASAVQLSSEARRLPAWYRDLPGGLLFDEVPHLLYTLHGWCGDLRLVSASATWRPDGHPGVVDLAFGGETPASATMVFGAPVSEWHVTLVGRRRIVDLDLFRDIAVRVGPDGPHRAKDIARTSAKAMLDHGVGFASSGLAMVRGRLHWGHDTLIAAFVEACLGRRENPVPVVDALAVVSMTDDLLAAIGARERAPAGRRPGG